MGRNLGTGPFAFDDDGDRVRVPMDSPWVWWYAVYDSPAKAQKACEQLTTALTSSDDPEATALRAEYSSENMRRFVHRYLDRDGLAGFERPTRIVVDARDGVHEVRARATLKPIAIENVLRVLKPWEQGDALPRGEMTRAGDFVMGKWPELSAKYRWSNLAIIFDAENPSGLLEELVAA